MKNIYKNVYEYRNAIESPLYSICEPIFNFGIQSFGYIKIFLDGSYLLVSPSGNDFMKQYLLNVTGQGITATKEIESSPVGKSHYILFPLDTPNRAEDPILDLYYSFDLWPVFTICKNKSDFVELYCFAKNKNDHHTPNFYINNLIVLEYFCDYFNETAKDFIDTSDKKKLGLFEQRFSLKPQAEETFQDQQIKNFLKETFIKKRKKNLDETKIFLSLKELEGIKHLCQNESVKEISGELGISSFLIDKSLHIFKEFIKPLSHTKKIENKIYLSSLSLRQQECLFLLTRGKTAKQIGKILGISHRTVETHIISLKTKLECKSKHELIEKIL